jgi:hypothetical protein
VPVKRLLFSNGSLSQKIPARRFFVELNIADFNKVDRHMAEFHILGRHDVLSKRHFVDFYST